MTYIKYILPLLWILTAPAFLRAQPLAGKPLTDSLQQALTKAKNDTGKVNLLNELSYNYRNIQPDSGLYYGKQAITLAQQLHWKAGLAKAFNCTGNNYFSLSDSANALENYQQALTIYQQVSDKDGMGWSLNYIGTIYLLLLSDYTKALWNHEQSYNLFQQVKDKNGLAACCENLAIAYESLGDYPKALQKFQQAESLDEQTCNNEALAINYSHMGIFYDDIEQYAKALDYCKKSLRIFQQSGNETGVAHNLISIGNIYLDLDNYTEAFNYYQQSFTIDQQLGDKSAMAKALGNMGMAYATAANFTEALKYYQQSFTLDKQLGNKTGMADVLGSIGYAYLNAPDALMNKKGFTRDRKYTEALQNLEYSLHLSKQTGDLDVQEFALKTLSDVYEKQENYSNAYKTYKDYIVVRDSILNNEKQKEITQKEIEYAYTKKETALTAEQDKKNALASAEIKKQTLIKNYTLAGVSMAGIFLACMIVSYNRRRKTRFDNQVMNVEMKALRAQMNPHFIFNSLHSINNYILENEKENASAYLSKFANLMRLILENSREQEVPLEEDLQTLELYLQLEALRFTNKFKYTIETDPQIDIVNTLIPPMLLQPFVENAILHGVRNKENGLIKIKVQKEEEMIRCIIEDNGKETTRIVIPNADEINPHKSLGKKIIEERLHIINRLKKVKASVNITDIKDDQNKHCGMRVELLLPLETAV